MDERQLSFFTNTNVQSATTTALPASVVGKDMTYRDFGEMLSDSYFLLDTVIPMDNVTELTPPPQAVLSTRLPVSCLTLPGCLADLSCSASFSRLVLYLPAIFV